MQMAIDVAGFSPGEADQLRQAMGSKRSTERMERLRQRLFDGMAERGITGAVAEEIYVKLAAFANYGFPESHSVSFAYLVYASAWCKYHHPAAFCAGLLNAQPMGFYSPHSLVADATRHGVEVRTPCINASAAGATLEPPSPPAAGAEAGAGAGADLLVRDPSDPRTWGHGGPAVRLGIGAVRGIGDELATEIAEGRPYRSMEDVARRNPRLTLPQLEALATAGAFTGLPGHIPAPSRSSTRSSSRSASVSQPSSPVPPGGPPRPRGRREDLWAAGAVAQGGVDRLEGIVTGARAPSLPGMSERETAQADLWATGIAPNGHPTRFVRAELDRLGVVPAADLATRSHQSRVLVGGVVTHRQRPATAGGTTFVNLEDETGLINVVVSKGCWVRHRRLVQTAPALLIRGRLETADGVVNVVAETVSLLPLSATVASRDFR
jgi:error-prone DNA polymerase